MLRSLLVLCLALCSSLVFAEEKILCTNSLMDHNAQLKVAADADKLREAGYRDLDMFMRKEKHTFVGIGALLDVANGDEGTVVYIFGALKGSSAARTEFFGKKPYQILAINGRVVGNVADPFEIVDEIRASSQSRHGVVLTLQSNDGGRIYERFLESGRISTTMNASCSRLVLPK